MRGKFVHRRLVTATALALVAFGASPRLAHADDSDLEAVLAQNVVTTASQTAETKATAPATSSVITAEEIHDHGIRSLNEAFNYLSLGFFSTNPAHGVETGARGILTTTDYGNHILLLIDGHTVNEPYAGAASFDRGLGVPIELVDHIEVILGPGAVLYGSNAMLGVVNVVTKRAKDYRGIHVVVDSDVATWGKAQVGAGGTVSFLGRPVELTGAIEVQHQDGPTLQFDPQPYGNDVVTGLPKKFSPSGDGTGVWGGTVSHSYYSTAPSIYTRAVMGNLELSLKASSYERASPYLDNVVNTSGDFDAGGVYELERWSFADLKYRIPVSRVVDLRLRAYGDTYAYDWYNKSSAAEDCNTGQTDGCNRDLRARSRWFGGEARLTFDWLQTNELVTMIGADARDERVTARSYSDPKGAGQQVIAGNVDTTNVRLGVYGQQTAQPTSWLFLNVGARGDLAEGYPGAVSPRAVAGVTPWKGATFKAIYSQAFRAPSSYERFWENVRVLANPDLKSEHEDSVEASFEQQLGAHRLLFGVFHTHWRDLVTLEQLSDAEISRAIARGADLVGNNVTQYQNEDKIENIGFNAGIDGSFLSRRLRYGLTLTGATSRRYSDQDMRLPLTLSPNIYGNGRVAYDLGGKLPTLALAGRFEGKRPTDGYFDPNPYADPVLEFRAAVSGAFPFVPGLSYRVLATYCFEKTGEYVVGPVQSSDYGVPPALNPIDQFRVGIGFQYDWAP